MYTDRNVLTDYPYHGTFYRVIIDDSTLIGQENQREIVYETECDITESSHSWSRNFIWAKYAVYFPFDKDVATISVKMGDLFEADMYGLTVNGKVVGVFPSQLGGVTCYIQDTDT